MARPAVVMAAPKDLMRSIVVTALLTGALVTPVLAQPRSRTPREAPQAPEREAPQAPEREAPQAPEREAPQPPGRSRTPPTRVVVNVAPGPDAPQPPTDRLKKSPPRDYNKSPAKRDIKAVEDKIYSMEQARATIWAWHQDPNGASVRDVDYVARQMTELKDAVAAVRTKVPGWARLSEYDRRIAALEAAHQAQRAHYAAVEAARDRAIADVAAADAAAWQAKRAKDDGVVGALHTAAVGTVVFGKAAFTATSPVTAAARELDVASPLYARAFLKESPWNALHTAGVDCSRFPDTDELWIESTVTVNGGSSFPVAVVKLARDDFRARTAVDVTYGGSLSAGGTYDNDDEGTPPFTWMSKVVGDLKPGKNTIQWTARAGCQGGPHGGVEVASSTLTITATAASLAEVGKRASFKMTASFHPAAKLARYREQLVKRYAADYDMLDFRSAGEWRPKRNDLGVVLARELPTVVLLRPKAGGRCVLMSVMLSEPFDGQTYGPALELAGEFPRAFVCQVK